MAILTPLQAQKLNSTQYGNATELAKALEITPANAKRLRDRGVFHPRHIVSYGEGGTTTHIFDIEDCRVAYMLYKMAGSKEAKMQAKDKLASYWDGVKNSYMLGDKSYDNATE